VGPTLLIANWVPRLISSWKRSGSVKRIIRLNLRLEKRGVWLPLLLQNFAA
jgi:hypothetical protein